MPATLTARFNENSSAQYSATIVDESETRVPGSILDELLLTLYDKSTGTIINSRDKQNVLNTNGVSIDENGDLVWTLEPEDNPILNDDLETEMHFARFDWRWDNTKRGHHEVALRVVNLQYVES